MARLRRFGGNHGSREYFNRLLTRRVNVQPLASLSPSVFISEHEWFHSRF